MWMPLYEYWRLWDRGAPVYEGQRPPGWPWLTGSRDEEISLLEDEARYLERDLGSIKRRLEELRK